MTVLQPQAKQEHGLLNIVHLQFTKALERIREGGMGKGKEGEKKGERKRVYSLVLLPAAQPFLTPTPREHTLDEMVAVLVFCQFECWPLLALSRRLCQQIVDELIVDLGKGDPNGELVVFSSLQLNGRVIMHLKTQA